MTSLSIILKQFKAENISEDEAIQLIRDVTTKDYYPYYIYNTPTNPSKGTDYTVTCRT